MSKTIITSGGGAGGSAMYEANFLNSNWTFVRDTSRDGYWHWEKFPSIATDSTTKGKLVNSTPTDNRWFLDSSISISMNIADSYTARCTIYCDAKAAFTTELTCSTDDAGYVYLNDSPIGSIASCTNVKFTFNFIKGINKLEFYYTEGSGGDGWLTNPHLQTMVGTNFNWICGEGHFEQTVNLKPKPRNAGIYLIKSLPESAQDKENKELLYKSNLFIGSNGGTITAYPDSLPTANTKIYFGGGVDNTNILKCDLLFGGDTTWLTGANITLAHPYTDYDLITFVYSHSGESLQAGGSSYVDSKTYPVDFLEDAQNRGGRIALMGYSTRFACYFVTNETTFTWSLNGDSGTTGIIAVYGTKVTPN